MKSNWLTNLQHCEENVPALQCGTAALEHTTALILFPCQDSFLQAICFKSHAQRVVGLSIQLKALMKALGHFSVFVSYIWGAYFFKEPIKDHILALVALAIMAIGMAGVRSAGSGNNLLSVAPNLWMSALRLPDEEEVGGTALLSLFALFLDCLHQVGYLF